MSERLIIQDYGPNDFRLVWWLSEEQEVGTHLGEAGDPGPNPPTDPEELKDWTAYQIAQISRGALKEGKTAPFRWESRRGAQAALAAIKLAWKGKRPLTDWEKKALNAGWKPPKGFVGGK